MTQEELQEHLDALKKEQFSEKVEEMALSGKGFLEVLYILNGTGIAVMMNAMEMVGEDVSRERLDPLVRKVLDALSGNNAASGIATLMYTINQVLAAMIGESMEVRDNPELASALIARVKDRVMRH